MNKHLSHNCTALIMTTKRIYSEYVEMLISSGADVNIIDNNGGNALYYSIANHNSEMTMSLINAGADDNIFGLN